MAGESYGGRYIPVFAAAVYDQNAALVKAGLEPINLKSIMIGSLFTLMSLVTRVADAIRREWHDGYDNHGPIVL